MSKTSGAVVFLAHPAPNPHVLDFLVRNARVSTGAMQNGTRVSTSAGHDTQGAQWLAEECATLQAERNNIDTQLADLVCALSKAAVHDPNVAKALPDIRKAIDPDTANRLDVALQYFAGEGASSPSGPQDAAAGGDDVG